MELDELEIRERRSHVPGHGHALPAGSLGPRSPTEDARRAAGGKDDARGLQFFAAQPYTGYPARHREEGNDPRLVPADTPVFTGCRDERPQDGPAGCVPPRMQHPPRPMSTLPRGRAARVEDHA